MSVRDLAERLFFVVERVVTATLVPWYALLARVGQVQVPVLMYHQVTHDSGARLSDDAVSEAGFETQMRALVAHGFRVIGLRELLDRLDDGRIETLRGAAVVTFDDGYRDQVRLAAPVLRRLGLTATFFLVTGQIDRGGPFPHLREQFARAGAEPPDGWHVASWEESGALIAMDQSVGSHSVTHRSLGLLDGGGLMAEVADSRAGLERHLGVPVDLFAYPFGSVAYGDVTPAVRSALRAAGYRGACTTAIGRNGGAADPLAIRRIPVDRTDGPFRIYAKLIGAYDWVGVVKTAWQSRVSRRELVDSNPPAVQPSRAGRGQ